jgi:hypothetical protein
MTGPLLVIKMLFAFGSPWVHPILTVGCNDREHSVVPTERLSEDAAVVGDKIAKDLGVRTSRRTIVNGVTIVLHTPSPRQQEIVHTSDLLDHWRRCCIGHRQQVTHGSSWAGCSG